MTNESNTNGHQPKKADKPDAQNPPSGGSQVKKVSKKASNKSVSIKKFKDLDGKFLLVRVGTKEEPASSAQINDIQTKLVELFEKNSVNCLTFVTHHAVDIDIIEKNGV